MEENICPSCNQVNRIENQFCTQCGARLKKQSKMGPRLIMLTGKGDGSVFQLKKEMNIIGRGPENSIMLDDEQISKMHAAILFEDNYYWIEDLKSKNGVNVNGKKITQRERLYNGSLLKLGSTFLRFETIQ